MKKRLLAFLLCLAMVLAMAPTNLAFLAKAAGNDELTLDANSMGYCPACDATVQWIAFKSGRIGSYKDGVHRHYYIAADMTAVTTSSLALLQSGSNLCLHLNGHTLTTPSYIQISSSTTLNIMGSGELVFTSAVATTASGYWKYGIYSSGGTVNLLGGTLSVTGEGIVNNIPAVYLKSGKLNVSDAVVNGWVHAEKGTMTLDKSA